MIDVRAAVLHDGDDAPRVVDAIVRPPAGDEVLVRIKAVGICHTDVSVAARWPARKRPMVFGHEGAGTVVAAGPGARAAVGSQVVLTFASCGGCADCGAGRPAYCASSTTLNLRGDGADESSALRLGGVPVRGGFFGQSSFATHVLTRPANTVVLERELEPALAAPLGCSVQTGVGTVLNALAVGSDDHVAVFGAGAVGLSAVMGARLAGARTIIAVDPVPERRATATTFGATATVDPGAEDVASAVVDATGGGPTAVVDTTARPDVIAAAVAALRPCGSLALVGLGAPTAEFPVGLVMAKGLRIRGVVEGDGDPHRFLPRLADLVRTGELPVSELVTRFDFEDFSNAWAAATSGEVIKPVLVVSG